MASRPELSVVSVTWNSADCVGGFLDSVAEAARGVRAEVVIVDNASSDQTVEIVRNFKKVPLRLIRLSRNVGYSRANNMGIRKARGEFVFLLNPDTVLEPDTIKVGLQFMRQHPEIAVLAPQMFYPNGRLQPSVRKFPDYLGLFVELTGVAKAFPSLSRWKLDPKPVEKPVPVEQPMGAALLMRRRVFLEAGAFDINMRMFFSDVDILKRLWEKGYQVWLHPRMRVKHYMGLSTRKAKPRMALEWALGLTRYFLKHHPKNPLNLPLNLLNWAVGLLRALVYTTG